jgi:hypothetical protein
MTSLFNMAEPKIRRSIPLRPREIGLRYGKRREAAALQMSRYLSGFSLGLLDGSGTLPGFSVELGAADLLLESGFVAVPAGCSPEGAGFPDPC